MHPGKSAPEDEEEKVRKQEIAKNTHKAQNGISLGLNNVSSGQLTYRMLTLNILISSCYKEKSGRIFFIL